MKPAFDREEVRVMGALIEKEITTPDNYYVFWVIAI